MLAVRQEAPSEHQERTGAIDAERFHDIEQKFCC
jgi:hypothetical protein